MAWVKGQSGNPSGRAKGYAEIEALARSHAPAAVAALVEAMADPRFRVQAATALLDRGFGRPAQTLTHENPDGTPLSIVIATAIPAGDDDQPAQAIH